MRCPDSAVVSYADQVRVWLPCLEKCRRHSWPRNKRRNMSGPTVSRAQTPGGDVQIGATVICVVCNRTDKLLKCSRCKAVFYCTKEHQRRDWKRHKEFCATHSVRSIQPHIISTTSENSVSGSDKTESSFEDNQKTNTPAVSNLSEKPVSETTQGSNAAPEVCPNAKQLGGT